MNELLKHDLYRYAGATNTKACLKSWFEPGFRYTYFLRKANSKKSNSFLGMVYRLFMRRYSYRYGIQIPQGTQIGKGFYIGHFGNIIINENAVIGENCNVAPGISIGQTNRGKKKGCPKIGDFVWIGTGSVLVGKIKIGNNVLIAPLSYVNIDVPDNSIVIGNPCKIIPNESATTDYINNVLK